MTDDLNTLRRTVLNRMLLHEQLAGPDGDVTWTVIGMHIVLCGEGDVDGTLIFRADVREAMRALEHDGYVVRARDDAGEAQRFALDRRGKDPA